MMNENRNVRSVREITSIYDGLILIAKMNIGKRVSMEWGTWVPSELGLKTMQDRRDSIAKGALSPLSLIKGV
tara:strand:- start:2421 stop:2636 length:216 start_codon:yes stop_codon:yes gene_type:complete